LFFPEKEKTNKDNNNENSKGEMKKREGSKTVYHFQMSERVTIKTTILVTSDKKKGRANSFPETKKGQ